MHVMTEQRRHRDHTHKFTGKAFAVPVEGGQVVVDTKLVILGPALGTNTTGQEQEGPHCA